MRVEQSHFTGPRGGEDCDGGWRPQRKGEPAIGLGHRVPPVADTNARTSFESTVYQLELPGNDAQLIGKH